MFKTCLKHRVPLDETPASRLLLTIVVEYYRCYAIMRYTRTKQSKGHNHTLRLHRAQSSFNNLETPKTRASTTTPPLIRVVQWLHNALLTP